MSAHIIIRDGKALAAVRTEPFDISLTDAGSEVSLLADYEDAKKITQVEAKAPEDGALALEEKWVNATDDTVLTLLGRIADINGWNIVPRNDLPRVWFIRWVCAGDARRGSEPGGFLRFVLRLYPELPLLEGRFAVAR